MLTTTIAVGLLNGAPAHAIGGGSPADQGLYPFVAKLDIGDRSCSGALIDPRWIITASSCFADNPQQWNTIAPGPPKLATTATIGRTATSGTNGRVVSVIDLAPRPDRDVVLAKLAVAVNDIAPLKVAVDAPAKGDVLRVAGYGRTTTEWVPERLNTATLAADTVGDTTLTFTAGDASTCKGDSGGPTIRDNGPTAPTGGRYELVGVHSTSWQHKCFGESAAKQGATETRVDNLKDWINGHRGVPQGWSDWLPRGGKFKSSPAVGTRGPGVIDLAVTSDENSVLYRNYSNNKWGDWVNLGGGVLDGTAPAVVAMNNHRVDVFVTGDNGQLHRRTLDNGVWSGWERPAADNLLTSGPAVASWGDGRLDVFARGSDNGLHHVAFGEGQWYGWYNHGGVITAAPAAVSWGPGRIDVMVRGAENQLIHKAFGDGQWWGWYGLDGHLTSAPSVTSRGPGQLNVFVRGGTGNAHHKAFGQGVWWGWDDLGGQLTPNTGPAAVANGHAPLDVVVNGNHDQQLYHKYWT